MQGNDRVIEMLNQVLTAELTGINQYFIHAKMCKNWGFHALAEHIRHESIDEMKHADEVIERILYLEGVPNLQRLGKLNVGETVPEQFAADLELERLAIARLNEGVALCREVGDNGTRELCERLLVSEEEHADWLETQQHLVATVGLERYLAEKIG
ncbi:MAG: bacterioferritin [Myxococcales bacterium FL481]|nr:MAG: bacterioferritin [Myxococcales bacterium FL481]